MKALCILLLVFSFNGFAKSACSGLKSRECNKKTKCTWVKKSKKGTKAYCRKKPSKPSPKNYKKVKKKMKRKS
ncbi:hypothetical protein N9O57_00030 [bacterium]|nr:hypothetical protein [bacterium]